MTGTAGVNPLCTGRARSWKHSGISIFRVILRNVATAFNSNRCRAVGNSRNETPQRYICIPYLRTFVAIHCDHAIPIRIYFINHQWLCNDHRWTDWIIELALRRETKTFHRTWFIQSSIGITGSYDQSSVGEGEEVILLTLKWRIWKENYIYWWYI